MGKKKPALPPPGLIDELLTRIERLEHRLAVLEDAARAFAVVYAIPRIPDDTGETGTTHEADTPKVSPRSTHH